jgi:hypothetical protein
MVNANRFISMSAIPLLIVAYAVFLWIDHSHNDHVDEDPIQSIQKIGSIDGLVFGGSNAVYSLSAESLSYYTGIKWHNASVMAELWTIKEHKNFIQDMSARIDRTKVRYVIFSSVNPYRRGEIARMKEKKQITEMKEKIPIKEKGLEIKPKTSVLGYVGAYIGNSPRPRNLQRNNFGDIVFDSVKCDFTTESDVKHEREDEDTSTDFLVDYTIFFASLFPNASILIVLPSMYYGALSFDDSRFEENLRTKFYNVLKRKYFKNTNVKIIFQPPYSSISQVCDLPPHANETGRVWRTRNLIEFMR